MLATHHWNRYIVNPKPRHLKLQEHMRTTFLLSETPLVILHICRCRVELQVALDDLVDGG